MPRSEAAPDRCRFCASPLDRVFVDLGPAPLTSVPLEAAGLAKAEAFVPLRTCVCESCWLVQLAAATAAPPEVAPFASACGVRLRDAEAFAEAAVRRFGLGTESRVVEIGSNDGYLLRFFKARGVPVLGIEPARAVAEAAEALGIPTLCEGFDEALARRLAAGNTRADLLVGNDVLGRAPRLQDLAAGLLALLEPDGVAALELPHLEGLIAGTRLDAIDHRRFAYFSFGTAEAVLGANGLEVFDVEELPEEGTLRLFAARPGVQRVADAVAARRDREDALGFRTAGPYAAFGERVEAWKRRLLRFVVDAREGGARLAGWGAPASGDAILSYCGIRADLLDYTVDERPELHGRFLAATRIPIRPPARLAETRPDYVLLLPGHRRDEAARGLDGVRAWGGRLVVAIPELEVIA